MLPHLQRGVTSSICCPLPVMAGAALDDLAGNAVYDLIATLFRVAEHGDLKAAAIGEADASGVISSHVNLPLLMFRMYDIFPPSSISYIRKSDMGRKKLWPERLTLPLTSETVAEMDAALQDGESRLDLIREAIDRELKRRKRASR